MYTYLRVTPALWLFLFVIFTGLYLPAAGQQPGGVGGARVWYVTEKTGTTFRLKDSSGNGYSSYGNGTGRIINFHPAFNVSQLTIPSFRNLAFSQGTVVGIYYPGTANKDPHSLFELEYLDTVTSLRNNKLLVNNRPVDYGIAAKRTNFVYSDPVTKLENAMKVGLYHNSTDKVFNSTWGEDKETSFLTGLKGYLAELIIYNYILSPQEIWKINSYLTIKYGITPDTSVINSNGDVIWDMRNKLILKYNHRVCAIGKDTSAGVWQPKSNTTYEEQVGQTTAFSKDADDRVTVFRWPFIPATDSPSLYRAVTINFVDKTLGTLDDKKYLFWGDDSLATNLANFKVRFPKYSSLYTVQRSWLIYNKDKIANPIKIVVAGADYEEPTLFNTLYNAFDYQLYRFVLVRLNPANPNEITKLQLLSYFGREQRVPEKFNTLSMIWDSITCPDVNTIFTIGRVPVLNFLEFGKTAKSPLIQLEYPFYPNSPITTDIPFDTIPASEKNFIFKKDEPLSAYFRVSEGVAPLVPKLYQLQDNGNWREVKDAIDTTQGVVSKVPDDNFSGPESTAPPGSVNPSSDDDLPPGPAPKEKLVSIVRHKAIKDQTYKAFNLSKLEPGKVYKIEVTDAVGQKTTLPFKTIVNKTSPVKQK
jgi:hypothetical protein